MRDWKEWIRLAGIRAIKTMAQTAIASIGVATVLSEIDSTYVISASIVSGIISLLTSLTGLPEEGVETIVERDDENAI